MKGSGIQVQRDEDVEGRVDEALLIPESLRLRPFS